MRSFRPAMYRRTVDAPTLAPHYAKSGSVAGGEITA
jgi:hypothetical protein